MGSPRIRYAHCLVGRGGARLLTHRIRFLSPLSSAAQFSVPDKFFKSPKNEPENSCFCTHQDGLDHPLCATDGLLDISRCKKGAPIVLSAPHFYKGDYRLQENVLGLEPEKSRHETFLEIEPVRLPPALSFLPHFTHPLRR